MRYFMILAPWFFKMFGATIFAYQLGFGFFQSLTIGAVATVLSSGFRSIK